MASLVAQMVKNLPLMKEAPDKFLGLAVPREKEMATHSSILDWRISWTEEPGGLYSSWTHKGLDRTAWLTLSLSVYKAVARLTLSLSSPPYTIIFFSLSTGTHYLFWRPFLIAIYVSHDTRLLSILFIMPIMIIRRRRGTWEQKEKEQRECI